MFQTKKPRSESQDGMNTSENQIVVYQPNETVRLDVRLENETVWLTQELIVIDAYPGVANGECCQCVNVASGQFQFPIEEAA